MNVLRFIKLCLHRYSCVNRPLSIEEEIEESVIEDCDPSCSSAVAEEFVETNDVEEMDVMDVSSEPPTVNTDDILENKVTVLTSNDKNNDDIEYSGSEREDSEASEVPTCTSSFSELKLALKESTGAEQLFNSSACNTPIDDETFDMNSVLISPKVPVKVKSRWRRTSELEQVVRNGSWDQSSCNSSPLAMSPRAALNPPLRSEEKIESIKEKVGLSRFARFFQKNCMYGLKSFRYPAI